MHTVEQVLTTVTEVEAPKVEWSALDRAHLTSRAATTLSSNPRPFIRWAGSKQRLLGQIVAFLPSAYRTYYEPFFGAGSMYFLIEPKSAVLNDACVPLVDMYRTVRRDPESVYAALQNMDVLDRDYYYKIRQSRPVEPIAQAARFIYLNRAGWNGLYRVNSDGAFNVPYGKPRSSKIVDEGHLLGAAHQLAKVGSSMSSGDFEDCLSSVGDGDLVFLDPPYASSKKREGFVDYNERLFSWDDQVRLAECAELLRKRGAHVLVTNAYNSSIRELYPNFDEHPLVRRSSLAAKPDRRRPVAESLLVS